MTKPARRVRCTKALFCDSLVERAPVNAQRRRAGLAILTYVNMRTGKKTRQLPVHYLDPKDRGMVLSFCPWCGFDFSKRADWPKEKDLVDVGEET